MFSLLDNDPVPDQIAAFALEVYSSDVLLSLVTNLSRLEFESRKDVVIVFSTLLRRQIGTISPTVEHLETRPKLFDALLMSYGNPDIALTCGTIVRDCIKHESLCKIVLQSQVLWALFDTVANAQFEVATDAFSTISDALCTHQKATSDFFGLHQTRFVEKMKVLMTSDNYVTQRQSLKLISTLIRRRSNYNFMTVYISDAANLRPVMVLLRNKSNIMRFEAFQIFKIFVANPKKTKPVNDILYKNRVKLVEFLKTFTSPDKKEDETFNDERNFIISQLSALQPSGATTPQPQQAPLPQQQQLKLQQIQQMQLQQALQQQAQQQHVSQGNNYSLPMSTPQIHMPSSSSNTAFNTPSGVNAPQNGYFPMMPVSPQNGGANGSSNNGNTTSVMENGNNNTHDYSPSSRNLSAGASNLSLNNYRQHRQMSVGGSNGSEGNNMQAVGMNMGSGSGSGASRLKPQLIGAVGSGAVLTPVVQTGQVLHFPSSVSQMNFQQTPSVAMSQLPTHTGGNGVGIATTTSNPASSTSVSSNSSMSAASGTTNSAASMGSPPVMATTKSTSSASSSNKPSPTSSPASSNSSLSRKRSHSTSHALNGTPASTGQLPMANQVGSHPTSPLFSSSNSNSSSGLHLPSLHSSPPPAPATRLVSQQR